MSNLYFNKTYQNPQKDTQEEVVVTSAEFVRTSETGDKVYFIENGNAHWVKTPEALAALGGEIGKEKILLYSELRVNNLVCEPITAENASKYKIQEKELVQEQTQPLETFDVPEGAIIHSTVKGMTSIIIPAYLANYPLFHMTGNCIGSIREHTDKVKTPFEIVLVLNGKKETIGFDKLEQTYADKIIELDENEGYAKAVNKGIRVSNGEYIVVMNNDVLVYNHWLEDMLAATQDLDLVMATPMYGMPYARAVEAEELRQKATDKQFSDFVDFSCVLVKRSVFNKVGMFNEEFFMYAEDLDLLRRMKQEGLKYASTKKVNTTHIISATASGIDDTPHIMNESKDKLRSIWGE